MKTFTGTAVAPATVLAAIEHIHHFSTFLRLARVAELTEVLGGPGPLTVFLPTDSAFARLGQATADDLINDPGRLTRVLTYHMVPGKLPISEVMSLTAASTLSGDKISIYGCNGVTVNDARVIHADIDCSNGIIHIINGVLFPE